jgi:hypothetical protein
MPPSLSELNELLTFLDAQKGEWQVTIHISESSSHPLLSTIPECLAASLTFRCSSLAEVALHEVEATEKKYSISNITWENRTTYFKVNIYEGRIKLRTSDVGFLEKCQRHLSVAEELYYTISTRLTPLKRNR